MHERALVQASGEGSAAPRPPSSSPQSDDLRPIDARDPCAAAVIADGVRYWHKGGHLGRMVGSGQFAHCIEVAALAVETGDADRFVQLFRSQGDYQALQRHRVDDEALGVDEFAAEARRTLGPAATTVLVHLPGAHRRARPPRSVTSRRAPRHRPLLGRLRRPAHRPSARGGPADHGQGRRLRGDPRRRRCVQAAQLDERPEHPRDRSSKRGRSRTRRANR